VSLDTIYSRCSHVVSRMPIITHIQEDRSPEVVAALDAIREEIMKRKWKILKGNANGPWHGVSDSGDKKSCQISGPNSPESVPKCD